MKDRHLIGFAIDREGPDVLVNLRQGNKSVSLELRSRDANTIAATLAAASSSDDDTDFGFQTQGRLDVKER